MNATPDFLSDLKNAKAYAHPVQEIKLIETHISWVFLTGDFVYKIKKPVQFSFLDYSTLDKRKFFCQEELRLNQCLSPDLYLGLSAIVKTSEGYQISDNVSNAVEFCVKMKQLPEEKRLNHLLEQKQVSKEDVEQIAQVLADFHSKAKIISDPEYSKPEKILSEINDIMNVGPVVEKEFSLTSVLDYVLKKCAKFSFNHADYFTERFNQNKIRECHGDLHSANIFLIEGKPWIFDCIEFNKDFQYIDVASDVAFMAMDLDAFGREDLSAHFVSKYLEFSQDLDLKKMLDFYKCYKANVRAKIAAFEFMQTNSSEARERIRKYIRLCERYSERLV
ncbi:MAG: hypothetical protein Q7S92_05470 [Candidatus Diapherotrites archaeon]|nr:hypothetical protein [Candidatus Diapherotrites archaeon]